MKAQMQFHGNIGKIGLTPSENDLNLMNNYMKSLEQKTINSKDQFGDKFGVVTIHLLKEFEWLTKQIEENIYTYLNNFGIKLNSISLFHQKSWPIVTRKGCAVSGHNHPNATLSVVYYLQCEENSGGYLILESEKGIIFDKTESKKETKTNIAIKPEENSLIIFPSIIKHKVNTYLGENPRLSIAYDITITSCLNYESINIENSIMHPKYWREFSKI